MTTGVIRATLRVGVLMGGMNIEREVSFNSGRTICDHLDVSKYDVVPLFQTLDGKIYVLPWHFLHRGKIIDFENRLITEATHIVLDDLPRYIDFMYIAVHGRYAEDGTLQGMLEVLNIPYLGTKVFGSAVGMEKSFQKKLLQQDAVPVPQGIVVYADEVATITQASLADRLKAAQVPFPLIIKPSHEGSSFGVAVCQTPEDLLVAVQKAAFADARFVQDVLVEQKIAGMEFVCVLLQQSDLSWQALPLTEVVIEDTADFFDYDQKYMPGKSLKITPARCSQEQQDKVVAVCKQVVTTLNFRTIARIDGILSLDGISYIIDPNTLTGMAPSTFLFHQAAEVGMGHAQLINFLIEQELRQYDLWQSYFGDGLMNQQNNQKFMHKKIRVGVLLGGNSNEREISLESGRNVCYKLSPDKYDVTPVFVNDGLQLFALTQRLLIKSNTSIIAESVTLEMQLQWADLPHRFDFVFLGLHGGKGENGTIQGMLEMLQVPYNGSGVLASSLCMDKFKTNTFLASQGFDVPARQLIEASYWQTLFDVDRIKLVHDVIQKLSLPLILKPHDDGCSMFVQKIASVEELLVGINHMFANNKRAALVEELIRGMELTVGVVGNGSKVQALPPSQAVTTVGILSIEEKFLPGAGHNITPAPLPASGIALVQSTLERAFVAVGCTGYARIDCFYQDATISPTGKERVVFIEINTLPALTPATCLFHQAAEVGIKPMELLDKIVTLGFEKHRLLDKADILSTTAA